MHSVFFFSCYCVALAGNLRVLCVFLQGSCWLSGRIHGRSAEEVVDFFVSRILEEIVEVRVSQERAQKCTEEQIANGPVPSLRRTV